MVIATTFTPKVRKNILAKARSGDYYVRLTNWDPKTGQHFVVFPTNKGLAKGVRFKPEYIKVRIPDIPRPNEGKKNSFDRRGGYAYKDTGSRFFRMSASVSKLLKTKSPSPPSSKSSRKSR